MIKKVALHYRTKFSSPVQCKHIIRTTLVNESEPANVVSGGAFELATWVGLLRYYLQRIVLDEYGASLVVAGAFYPCCRISLQQVPKT